MAPYEMNLAVRWEEMAKELGLPQDFEDGWEVLPGSDSIQCSTMDENRWIRMYIQSLSEQETYEIVYSWVDGRLNSSQRGLTIRMNGQDVYVGNALQRHDDHAVVAVMAALVKHGEDIEAIMSASGGRDSAMVDMLFFMKGELKYIQRCL